MNYTDEYVKKLFETSKSQSEILRKLGRKRNGAGDRLIKKLAKQIGLDLGKYGNNANKLSREAYDKSPRHCKYCGKELTYEQRENDYCSHSCSAKVGNTKRTHSLEVRKKISESLQKKNSKNNGLIRPYEEKETNFFCLNCGKELSENQKYNKFCCHKCSTEYRYNNIIKKWLNGENFVKGGHQIPAFIKKYLMELHNNKCEKCGWGEEHPITHTIPLAVHHVDGDCTNNHIDNLQLLCPNCHCLTENFGSLNKNSKRFHRKKNSKEEILLE